MIQIDGTSEYAFIVLTVCCGGRTAVWMIGQVVKYSQTLKQKNN